MSSMIKMNINNITVIVSSCICSINENIIENDTNIHHFQDLNHCLCLLIHWENKRDLDDCCCLLINIIGKSMFLLFFACRTRTIELVFTTVKQNDPANDTAISLKENTINNIITQCQFTRRARTSWWMWIFKSNMTSNDSIVSFFFDNLLKNTSLVNEKRNK